MKKIFSLILSATIAASLLPMTVLAQNETDYTDTLTKSAYGGEGVWWDHSDAEATTNADGSVTIKNVDNNSSYSAVDVANDALGDKYASYTEADYTALYDSGTNIQTLVREALTANEAAGKRTLGKTNHGLFSNKIAVSTQSTEIKFTAKFDEAGAFVEVSNSGAYGPYINTDNGNITVNTGYANDVLLENFDTNKWYTFDIVLHDGRTANPVNNGTVTVYENKDNENGVKITAVYNGDKTLKNVYLDAEEEPQLQEGETLRTFVWESLKSMKPLEPEQVKVGEVNNLKLHYTDADWYKVNFFPNSRNGAQMELKDFSVTAYGGTTPKATPLPTLAPYPTLEPTPSPTPTPPGHPTPKPTLNPQPADDAKSKNVYTFAEDFEPYVKQIGAEDSIVTDKFAIFDAITKVYDDETNNKFITLTNAKSGNRYLATDDAKTTAIETKAVASMKVKFNKLAANDNGNVAVFDLTASTAHNNTFEDKNLVIAEKISVDCAGKVKAGESEIGTVEINKWYTIKSVSDVANKTNSIYVYDESGNEIGKAEDVAFYDNAATAVKNIRFDICRGSGSYSIDDVYIYELKDTEAKVFDDVSEDKAPLINYLATLGIAKARGAETGFSGSATVTDAEMNEMITAATETESTLSGTVTREALYAHLVEIYKTRSGDEEPVQFEAPFTDKASIGDENLAAIGTATKLGLTPVKSGAFEPDKEVSRYEAAQAVSRLISAINVGITDKIQTEPEEEIVVPHVIDQLPETGVMRDPMVNLAADGYYYMCCSTGTPPDKAKGESFPQPKEVLAIEGLWNNDTGIRIWRSKDLIDWTPVKSAKKDSEYPYYIWNIYEGGTWEKVNAFAVHNINVDGSNGNKGAKRFSQVLWAPEIHWVKGTYFIVYCMNPGGTSIARSVSGKPEGPYVRQECSQDTLLNPRIDASMFWDDDNTVYYTDGSCAIWRMNSDMSAIATKSNGNMDFISAQAPGKEGGFLFKHNGIYYATAGEFDAQGGYDAVVGMNKTGRCMANGSYKEIHWLYTLGHNGYFEDKDGNWWATMFGNDNDPLANATNGFNNGFALVPIDFDKYTGKIIIDTQRLDAWNTTLQEHGYSFAK